MTQGLQRSRGLVALSPLKRTFRSENSPNLNWTDLSCQYIELVGERHDSAVIGDELVFANQVYQINVCQHVTCIRSFLLFQDQNRPM